MSEPGYEDTELLSTETIKIEMNHYQKNDDINIEENNMYDIESRIYGINKPKREIIKARISHDKD